MNERTWLGLRILVAALLLGVLGDWLFMRASLGLNLLLWVGALLACVFWLRRARGVRLTADALYFALWTAVFGVLSVGRASFVLKSLDLVAILVALSLLVWHTATGARARVAGIFNYVGATLRMMTGAEFGGVPRAACGRAEYDGFSATEHRECGWRERRLWQINFSSKF